MLVTALLIGLEECLIRRERTLILFIQPQDASSEILSRKSAISSV